MGSTNALFTGLSGLRSNQQRLDVIGNNIANVNTTAFKSSRMIFATLYAQTTSLGSAPGLDGGTNPLQIGHGTMVAGTQRNFSDGAHTSTGIATDMAIYGDGFFVVQHNGEQVFTRDGAFQLDENRRLVTAQGGYVMGWGVDDQWQIMGGELQALEIPLGVMSVAEATSKVYLDGQLDAAGDIATSGSIHRSATLWTDTALSSSEALTWDPDNPDATGSGHTDLTVAGNNLYIDDGEGNPLLALEGGAQAIITVSGVEKNGQSMGTHTFAFSSETEAAELGAESFGSNMQDFTDWLETVLGLHHEDIEGQNLGGRVEIDPTGALVIIGNEGTVQDLDLSSGDITVSYGGTTSGDPVAGDPITQPFRLNAEQSADGEAVRTTFVAYDSLGDSVTVHVSMVLQETLENGGTTWTFLAESPDAAGLARIVGSGNLTFDASGELVSISNSTISIPRDNGSDSPLVLDLDFSEGADGLTSPADATSSIVAISQNGFPGGELVSYSVDDEGMIIGAFTNGTTKTLGLVSLAMFANPGGLEDVGDNYFRVGPNSGEALITAPGTQGAGSVFSGYLEMSNVDLSQEFINMILASTGYQASSRVINASNEMLDQLMLMAR
ncbi:MAG: flagellar hook-basal body complex protein [Planctomycetota bacterium]|nr:flagellar hook-basal body complex protein [Planctomycetota bacterium]